MEIQTSKLAFMIVLALVVLPLVAHGDAGPSEFTLREVPASEILDEIQKGESVEYDHVRVVGDFDLSKSDLPTKHVNRTSYEIENQGLLETQKIISSPIKINDSVFDGFIDFSNAFLEEKVDFSRSNFTKYACFSETSFSGGAYFRQALFSGYTDFGGASFSSYADFENASFSSYADFSRASFSGYADFIRAAFSSNADFFGASFHGGSYFYGASFRGYADFGYAEFNGNIEFGNTQFKNETSFYRTLFERPAYFDNSSVNSLNLTKADYTLLHLHWNRIENLDFDEGAYLAVIKNYNNLGWYNDANECYYDYRNEVRKNWLTAYAPDLKTKISNILNWFIDAMEWLLYGYGVQPLFPIVWSGIIVLFFGLFFFHKKCLKKIIVEENIEESKDQPNTDVLITTKTRKAQITPVDPLFFSLFTFTSGFTSFLHPSVEYKLDGYKRWVIAERLLGPLFVALFITAVSRTYLIR